ncbi:MAG TPA: uracil phosphoribosyltransferase [Salinimicrobium sp.]|nr:uracil phosphoribosyltransferase [Salinimicrobium sp.]
MKDLFEGIQYLFEEILFAPLNALAKLELESWFFANIINVIFILIGIAAFAYWLKQLKDYDENTDSTYQY